MFHLITKADRQEQDSLIFRLQTVRHVWYSPPFIFSGSVLNRCDFLIAIPLLKEQEIIHKKPSSLNVWSCKSHSLCFMTSHFSQRLLAVLTFSQTLSLSQALYVQHNTWMCFWWSVSQYKDMPQTWMPYWCLSEHISEVLELSWLSNTFPWPQHIPLNNKVQQIYFFHCLMDQSDDNVHV